MWYSGQKGGTGGGIVPGNSGTGVVGNSSNLGSTTNMAPTSVMAGASMAGAPGVALGGLGPKYKHEHDLEHSLHQLLHRVYHHSFQHPLPHPVYAYMGMSKRRRAAGPEGMDKTQVSHI